LQAVPGWKRRDIIVQTVGDSASLGYSIRNVEAKLFLKVRRLLSGLGLFKKVN
jgi:hypothetical protein